LLTGARISVDIASVTWATQINLLWGWRFVHSATFVLLKWLGTLLQKWKNFYTATTPTFVRRLGKLSLSDKAAPSVILYF
jgi:hypothetical protein